jgi:hypothetical protein
MDMTDALKAVTEVAEFGAKKYAPRDWLFLDKASERYEEALLRHTMAIYQDKIYDEESKLLHLAHRAWNALATLQLYLDNTRETVA